jgi:hypothetical protein
LLFGAEPVETPDDLIGLAAAAAVCLDSLDEVGCSTVMEKENALPDTPERRCSEFIRPRSARHLIVNHLFPPFNDVRARRAILMALSQED